MRRALVASVLGTSALIGCLAGPEDEPVEDQAPSTRGVALAELDRQGCVACHASPALQPVRAVQLADFGAFRSPAAIEAAMSRHQPDLLAARSEAERAADLRALTHALVQDGGPLAVEELALDAGLIEFGRQLYHGIGCVACHEPFEEAATLSRALWDFPEAFQASQSAAGAPHEFAGLRGRTSLAALDAYLREPLARHPSGRMPSLALDEREGRALAGYLLYEDAQAEGVALTSGRGLVLEYYEGSFPGETVDYDALVPVRTEVATSFFEGLAHREDGYGFRFRGAIDVPASGRYTFYTTSDDGSMLYIDGALVVDNRGQHGPVEAEGEVTLTAGGHALEVTFFEHMGGDELSVRWKGPGFAKQELTFERLSHHQVKLPARPTDFTVDANEAARGRELLKQLDCFVCHGDAPSRAPALAELRGKGGCLSGKPAQGRPTYTLSRETRGRLAGLTGLALPAPTEAERLGGALARLDCTSCHVRGEGGGPSDERRSYFQVVGGLDLGDEGRLPPSLDQVGAKLKEPYLREVLVGDGRVRPYMKTRMPHFGPANVEPLVELFAEVDAPLLDTREPEFSVAAVEAGKELVGTKGLGCIQCHTFGGHASLGIPAVDLAGVHARIQPGWFRSLLMDPVALKMNTRMPAFWVDGKSPVKSVLDGDPARQVDAIWSYLSLGASMPLPHGLVPIEGEYEVEVYDVPVAVGVFMKDVSPRTICVGLPERVHYAFDVENSRLAKAWRGRFFDARGTWHARAGELEEPPSEDVLEFPAGPLVTRLARPEDPWPTDSSDMKTRALGRGFDKARRPVFSYQRGDVTVREGMRAELRPGGATLVRGIYLHCSSEKEVDLRLAVGRSIRPESDSTWKVDAMTVRCEFPNDWEALVVSDKDGRMELRLRGPIHYWALVTGGSKELAESMSLDVEYSW